jgi:hypothetical protein
MGRRFTFQRYHVRSLLHLLPLFCALLSVLACGVLEAGFEEEGSPVSSAPGATVSGLVADNAHLATRVAALAAEDAQQATQLAALATENAQPATQLAALATETARRTGTAAVPRESAPAEPWQWTWVGSMTAARSAHTATLLPDGRVLLVAGSTAAYPDVSLSSAEVYDPASGAFRTIAPLSIVRHEHSATLLPDGRVLVIGGYNDNQGWLSSAEIYDPAAGQWGITQPIFAHGIYHTATLLPDGRVLVMAGTIQSGSAGQSGSGGPDDRVEIFDPMTDRWQPAAPHEDTESNQTATLLPDGRVLIAGGAADPAIYDPTSDTWQPAGSLPVNRGFTRAVLLQDGRVLLLGGLDLQNSRAINNVQIYDPSRNAWQQAAPLAQARFAHTATLLSDGRVLVTGGASVWDTWDDPGAVLSSVEIYDPASDTWSAFPSLQQARAEHTATLLPDGQVLVTGGRANRRTALDSVEILQLEGH